MERNDSGHGNRQTYRTNVESDTNRHFAEPLRSRTRTPYMLAQTLLCIRTRVEPRLSLLPLVPPRRPPLLVPCALTLLRRPGESRFDETRYPLSVQRPKPPFRRH